MSKHTPGPWKHEVHESDYRGTGVIWSQNPDWEPGMYSSPNTIVVAEVIHWEGPSRPWRGAEGEEFEANARLIAAAPEMLEALKAISSEVANDAYRLQNSMRRGDQSLGQTLSWVREKCRAAIAKAEGREP